MSLNGTGTPGSNESNTTHHSGDEGCRMNPSNTSERSKRSTTPQSQRDNVKEGSRLMITYQANNPKSYEYYEATVIKGFGTGRSSDTITIKWKVDDDAAPPVDFKIIRSKERFKEEQLPFTKANDNLWILLPPLWKEEAQKRVDALRLGNEGYVQIIESLIVNSITTTLDDVVGLEDVKVRIIHELVDPFRWPHVFKQNEPFKHLLLYGPPVSMITFICIYFFVLLY